TEAAKPWDVVENIRSFKALSGWDFIHAAPSKELITSGGGYCMFQAGVEYVCYFPTGGSKTITLNSTNYRAEWWNPRTGGFYNVTNFFHSGGGRTLSSPDSNDWVLHITATAAPTTALQPKAVAGAITIDGNSGDWNLSEFTTKIYGGEAGTGDTGIVGRDGPVNYCGGHMTGYQWGPLDAADHSAKIYSRHDQNYLYFLVRIDDNDMRFSNPASANWNNDCVEFYIDPGHDHGSTPISASTSDAQIVIDANNQMNVYETTSEYATQILGGVTSAVVRDSTGWWLEAKFTKSAFSPAIPSLGSIGIDFAFRDNDGDNNSALTTIYPWREPEVSATFPTKIPSRWGDLDFGTMPDTTPPGPVSAFTATSGDKRITLNWTNPTDSDFTKTMIRYKTTGFPTGPADGALLGDRAKAPGTSDSYVHISLTNGTTYYYSAFAHDVVPNYSAQVDRSAVPADVIAPASVTAFNIIIGDQKNYLSWTKPTDTDLAGVKILAKTGSYPTGIT
ncbi:MAG: sugar-binding protein, partial [Armatimonadota bacterium]|nr:sugar-binding protein [Armatimonadota bacterium]